MNHSTALHLVALVLLACGAAQAVQPGFRILESEMPQQPLGGLLAGIGKAGSLDEFTVEGWATGAEMASATSWDFSELALPETLDEVPFLLLAPPTGDWTCYLPDDGGCGFAWPGVDFLRVQHQLDGTNRQVVAVERDEERWLVRAATIAEGTDDEVRLCFEPGGGAAQASSFVFPNSDGSARWMAEGDPPVQSEAFDCDASARLGSPCNQGVGVAVDLTDGNGTTGTVLFRTHRAGTLTLPSGHQLDALLAEQFMSVNLQAACLIDVERFRQHTLTWLVPQLGPVATMLSEPDLEGGLGEMTQASTSFLGLGLLPPLSLALQESAPGRVSLAWDPGRSELIPDGWIVQWDGDRPQDLGLGNESPVLPAGARSHELSGLAPGSKLHVSVLARRLHADPFNGQEIEFRSLALPLALGSDPDGDGILDTSYPPELVLTVPGGERLGDLHPLGVGDGVLDLLDLVQATRVQQGREAEGGHERLYGDLWPGRPGCERAPTWCPIGDESVTVEDLAVLRAFVAGALDLDCPGCEDGGPERRGEDRLPADVAPAGGDGRVDVQDVIVLLRFAVGLVQAAPEQALRGDVAPSRVAADCVEALGDGRVDVSDVIVALRSAVGLGKLAWPLRSISLRQFGAESGVAMQVSSGPWPAGAIPVAAEAGDCADGAGIDVDGSSWIVTCVSDPGVRTGPRELARIDYRAPGEVDAATLTIEALLATPALELGEVAAFAQ